METLESKKVRLLGRWLAKRYTSIFAVTVNDATEVITLLDEIEQAHYSKEFAE